MSVIIQGSVLSGASAWSSVPCGHRPEILNNFTFGFVWVEPDRTVKQLGAWLVSNSTSPCLISPRLILGHSHPWGRASLSPLHSLAADHCCLLPTARDKVWACKRACPAPDSQCQGTFDGAQQGGAPCPFPAPGIQVLSTAPQKGCNPLFRHVLAWCSHGRRRGLTWPSASVGGPVYRSTTRQEGAWTGH